MKEEFEYGEEVMVRDHDTEEWKKAYYMMTAPKGRKLHWAVTFPLMKEWIDKEKATWVCPFAQIRKIQPEPANKPEPIEHWVGRLQTQVMSLMDRVGEIEDGLQPIDEIMDIDLPEGGHEGARATAIEEYVMEIHERIDKFEAIFNAFIKNVNEKFQSIDKQLK